MKDLKSRFIELKDTDKYQRVASSHPIAWYVGLDGRNRYSLFAAEGSTNLLDESF